MNKSQLVDALADRLGDRRTAATAVDALLQIVVDTVRSGDSVSLAGFGVFESRARAARTGRNPRTGEAVDVPATTVPAFRPGTGFRSAVAGGAAPEAARSGNGAAASNGASSPRVATAVNGSVDLEAPPTATVLTDAAPTGKGKKKAAAAEAVKGKAVKDGTPKDKAKKGKKGKK